MDKENRFPQQSNCAMSLPADWIGSLRTFRLEWEEAAHGESLVQTQGSVGLILADLLAKLGLAAKVQKEVMGIALYEEISQLR